MMMNCVGTGKKISGAVAFEFLIVFPFVISLIYAAAVYGIVFTWQVRMQIAVDRATANAMRVDRSLSSDQGAANTPLSRAVVLASTALTAQGTLPEFMGALNGTPCRAEGDLVVCRILLPLKGAGADGEACSGPGATGSGGTGLKQLGFFGGFPPLPQCLTASASVAI